MDFCVCDQLKRDKSSHDQSAANTQYLLLTSESSPLPDSTHCYKNWPSEMTINQSSKRLPYLICTGQGQTVAPVSNVLSLAELTVSNFSPSLYTSDETKAVEYLQTSQGTMLYSLPMVNVVICFMKTQMTQREINLISNCSPIIHVAVMKPKLWSVFKPPKAICFIACTWSTPLCVS